MSSIILYHASKKVNRESIIKNGLMVNKKSSGYGKTPKHRAVYLYHENNIDVPCDMIDMYGSVDIFKVTIRDKSKLIPDEDSNCSTWEQSLEKMGTVAYIDNIPSSDIVFICNIKDEVDITNTL